MCLLYEYSFNTHKTPGEILGGAARVPLAVLRLAVYELLTAGAENERIIINEALEICRTYADEKAVAFVNGVLGKAADAVGSARA